MRLASFTGIVVLMLSLGGSAHAGGANEKERTALFREGSTLAEKGDWQGAAEKFRAVIAIRSAPKALLALGIAEEQLGHLLRAKEAYARAGSDAHQGHLRDDEKAAVSALAILMPRIPHLVVRLPAYAEPPRVMLDGQHVPVTDEGMEVDPGPHRIVIEDFEEVVYAVEGQRVEVVVPLRRPAPTSPVLVAQPAATSSSAAAPRPAAPESSKSTAALVVAGGGLVLGGAGVVFLALGKAQEDDAKALCPGGGSTGCPNSARSDADASRTKLLVGDVLLGVGAAALIGGGIWWLLSGKTAQPERKTGILLGPNEIVYRATF